MSTWQTVALGAVAGFTIFLGLPLGRMKRGSVGFKTFLSGLSAGILVFLLFDVLAHATEPVEEAVVDGDWGQLVAVGLVYVLGLGLGLLSIPYFFRFTLHRARPASLGPGAMAVAEVGLTPDREALRLGMTIAAGIGLHNFSEGLAIGQAANANEISLAVLLVVGFALHNATEPVEGAVIDGDWGQLVAVGLVYVAGLGLGLLSIPYFFRFTLHRARPANIGPGAMAVAEVGMTPDREALRLGMTIAAGIGLHNFSEGLAIGQAANANEISLAVLLVVGFALHNATEGFGIVGPLAGAGVQATWGWLLLAGLVAGGPTFVGTLVGTAFSSEYVFVGFLALAAGAILYVIGELFASGRRLSWILTLWGVFGGFLLGLATDLVIEAAGG